MLKPIISADSHVAEPPGTYVERIDRRYHDTAPRIVRDAKWGDVFVIHGMDGVFPIGQMAGAGKRAKEIPTLGARFEDMPPGGWNPDRRPADQDRDGIAAEALYPTVGLFLCTHPDHDYKKACFDAYNLWIAEYCAAHPDRLIGVGQTAMRSAEEGIADFRENVYTTFQDDWVAFRVKDLCNIRRLMWANDFPHADSTWPWSQELLTRHTKGLSEHEKDLILHDNVAELYQLDA